MAGVHYKNSSCLYDECCLSSAEQEPEFGQARPASISPTKFRPRTGADFEVGHGRSAPPPWSNTDAIRSISLSTRSVCSLRAVETSISAGFLAGQASSGSSHVRHGCDGWRRRRQQSQRSKRRRRWRGSRRSQKFHGDHGSHRNAGRITSKEKEAVDLGTQASRQGKVGHTGCL